MRRSGVATRVAGVPVKARVGRSIRPKWISCPPFPAFPDDNAPENTCPLPFDNENCGTWRDHHLQIIVVATAMLAILIAIRMVQPTGPTVMVRLRIYDPNFPIDRNPLGKVIPSTKPPESSPRTDHNWTRTVPTPDLPPNPPPPCPSSNVRSVPPNRPTDPTAHLVIRATIWLSCDKPPSPIYPLDDANCPNGRATIRLSVSPCTES